MTHGGDLRFATMHAASDCADRPRSRAANAYRALAAWRRRAPLQIEQPAASTCSHRARRPFAVCSRTERTAWPPLANRDTRMCQPRRSCRRARDANRFLLFALP
ncbi:hypothetical protein DB771_02700 [Burkholderia sp. AU29985]|nr:hypothetical protein XM57_15955 [Burkholderia cepacia]AYZ96243.1 hypothetical protein EGY28_13760 [Burkholderia dolosa]ETP66889.1 hypothetical protein BDSB_12510 [Burkholderia dolosa PC543]PRE45270.1 hypothetical protein C6P87_21205 [Burkholderia sp. AU12872]PUA78233.1 hypothetical protein DB771_02700 [Burkholderia sp. AU29985]